MIRWIGLDWCVLDAYGVRKHILGAVRSIYENYRANVKAHSVFINLFLITHGVRQGCLMFHTIIEGYCSGIS